VQSAAAGQESDEEFAMSRSEGDNSRAARVPAKPAQTRRGLFGLLMRSSAVAALFGSTFGMRGAAAAENPEPPRLQVCPNIDALRRADPQQGAAFVEGIASAGDGGGGLFVWINERSARNDGAVRVASERVLTGQWLREDYASGRVRPQWFGAMQTARDHSVLIQSAIDFVEAEGRGVVDLGNRQYKCFARIVVDPTQCSLVGNSAVLDFSGRRAPPTTTGSILTLGRLGDPVGWTARPNGAGQWQYLNGALAYTWADGDRSVVTRSASFRQLGRYRLSVTLSDLRDDRVGPAVTVSFKRVGLPDVAVRTTERIGEFTSEFEWPFDGPGDIEVRANASCRIERLSVDPVGETECILVRTKGSSPQYSHASQSISGIRIVGPDRDNARPTPSEGILFATTAPAKSSRISVRNVEISGCVVGCKFLDRAYLIQFHDVRFNARTGVEFISGASDAGENIAFFGCTFDASNVPIRNAGADIYAYGCSFDYTRQFYVGGGLFHSFGCHYETGRPKEPAQYPFEIHSGDVYLSGGVLMISGIEFDLGNKCDYIFWLENRSSRVFIENVSCWNLRSASGFLAGGKGRIYAERILGIGNKQVAHLTKRDDVHNLLGPAGRLKDDRILLDISLSGGELTDRLVSSHGRIVLDPSASRSDSKPLAVIKEGPPGAPLRAVLLVPFVPGRQFGWQAFASFRQEAGAKGTIFLSTSFVQVSARDRFGAPVIAASQYWGEIKYELGPSLATKDWTPVGLGSEYSDNTSAGDGYAPEWTTHVAIVIDLTQVPPASQILLDDIYCCRF
jgi:hypothetical protein